MHEVPFIGQAMTSGVLAHWGNDEAVLQAETCNRKRIKQFGHGNSQKRQERKPTLSGRGVCIIWDQQHENAAAVGLKNFEAAPSGKSGTILLVPALVAYSGPIPAMGCDLSGPSRV
jgi:hypothetical protein